MMKSTIVCVLLVSLIAYVQSDCTDFYGATYSTGTGPFIGKDGCNTCFCAGEEEATCTRMFCAPGINRCIAPNGNLYDKGSTFSAADDCNTCSCTETGAQCTEMACVGTSASSNTNGCVDSKTGQLVQIGQTYTAADGCNTCFCSGPGAAACTAMFCGPLDG